MPDQSPQEVNTNQSGVESKPPIPEVTTPEKRINPHTQVLIDAYGKYVEYKQHFTRFEQEDVDPSTLQPPWNMIAESVKRFRRKVKFTMGLAGNTSTPEELGAVLYSASRKRNQSPAQGMIKGYQRGLSIVLVFDNRTDFMNISKVAGTYADTHIGYYESRTILKLGEEGKKITAETPTIGVLNGVQDTEEENIHHEQNHQYIREYLGIIYPEKLAGISFEKNDARKAINQFGKEEINEEALLAQLRSYASYAKADALLENATELMATQKPDRRPPYTDIYFDDLCPEDTNPLAQSLVQQVREEFRQQTITLQDKVNDSLIDFERLEKDKEIVYGTIGMTLIIAKIQEVDAVVEGLGIIEKILSGVDSYNARQELLSLKESFPPATTNTTPPAIQRLWDQLRTVTQETKALNEYGYKDIRAKGDNFATALTCASNNRDILLGTIAAINIQKPGVVAELESLQRLEQVRKTVAAATTLEVTQGNKPVVPTISPQRKNLLTGFKRLFGK